MGYKFQQFNPFELHEHYASASPAEWRDTLAEVSAASIDELRARNAYWFAEVMGVSRTVPMLWVINCEFTRRGIAPRWRGGPRLVSVPPGKRLSPVPPPLLRGAPPLSDLMKRMLLTRWVDLEWLRVELGPAHSPRYRRWGTVFSAPGTTEAASAFARVLAVYSEAGQPQVEKAWKIVEQLSVPKPFRRALTGLIDRDAGEVADNLTKRLEERYRPALEALMHRDRHKLTLQQVEHRLLLCEAIDLARGSVTEAVRVYRWMTGETMTRQSMDEMKRKIAQQAGFDMAAWR